MVVWATLFEVGGEVVALETLRVEVWIGVELDVVEVVVGGGIETVKVKIPWLPRLF